ncbi:YlmC/YmxH family sporulation protein [Abyssisolibacter fermentans]|uniref:YlmC/YmxH family sporulation protein n=1 Tax=Abyssisolibacter fermentans TaxID=1766203 RepID=UPI000833E4FE|nr:YlmC/YmxH family sporulation protein [Abyssisolibacter fermentans]
MIRISELRDKEIINIKDGTRVGMISDLEINLEKGIVEALILPMQGSFLGLFSRGKGYYINWSKIVKIGIDVVLIDYDPVKDSYVDRNMSTT